MRYATLMAHLELGHPNDALLKVASGLAERLHAEMIGVAACQPMRVLYNDGYVPGEIIDQDRRQIEDEMAAAEAEFRAVFGTAAAWRGTVTYQSLAARLAEEARCADLVITSVARNASLFDTSRHVDVGDLVMQAGRPCLIVPAGIETLALKHVVVAWKDTAEARRAISDALPLLSLAGRVTVVEITAEAEMDDTRARVQDVVGWLGRHGVGAAAVVTPSAGEDAVRLDAIAEELGADLLVAGAYGHSRVREWVLGGVTRDLLLRAGRASLVSH
jgi:nucleotide-binding universal stress UspA family protein